MASMRSSGKGRAVRMVEEPVIPCAVVLPAWVAAEVVAEEVAKAELRVDFVMRVFWRLPLLGVEGFGDWLSSACAWERSLRRRRWWARLFRADKDEEENFEKKMVSSRCGICEARYAEVRIRVGKYGNVGRDEGADTGANEGFAIAPAAPAGGSSGTI